MWQLLSNEKRSILSDAGYLISQVPFILHRKRSKTFKTEPALLEMGYLYTCSLTFNVVMHCCLTTYRLRPGPGTFATVPKLSDISRMSGGCCCCPHPSYCPGHYPILFLLLVEQHSLIVHQGPGVPSLQVVGEKQAHSGQENSEVENIPLFYNTTKV